MKQDVFKEELANSLTHGLGIILSLAGGSLLIVFAALTGSPWKIVGVSVFVASLLLLYAASTTYHAVRTEPLKQRLQILDHAAIYVLIAGTYTPFLLDAIRGPWGWSLFGVIWGLAIAGVLFKLFFTGQFPRVSTAIYIGMGWLVVIAIGPLLTHVPLGTFAWLLAGGVAYTAGTAFYHTRRPYMHAVWHMFVLTGSICHAIAVAAQL